MNSPSANLYSHNHMQKTNEEARRLLFRATTGAEPLPTTAEIQQARSTLAEDQAAQAALDELLQVITTTDRTRPAQWYDQLHAYAAAHLAGQGDRPEFAPVRRLLDADVGLAEEYALLYETLRAEAAGLVPRPAVMPPVDLSFLPAANTLVPTRPTPTGWLARQRQTLPTPLRILERLLQQMGRGQRWATGAAMILALLSALWVTDLSWRDTTPASDPRGEPTATAVSQNDPRTPEEPLTEWVDNNITHPAYIENSSYAPCMEIATSSATRRGCPM